MEGKAFSTFYDKLSSKLAETKQVDSLTSEFKECKTDAERVAFVLRAKTVTDLLQTRTYCRPKAKDHAHSQSFRAEGNSYFKRKDFKKALQYYTKSVFNAPCTVGDTTNLSLALANRSAVLFHMEDYKGCIRDAEEAISLGYPEKLKYKLLDRIARSQLRMGFKDLAKETFEIAVNSLNYTELWESKKNEIRSDIERLHKISDNNHEGSKRCAKFDVDFSSLPPEIDMCDINQVYPCARASFDIKYDPLVGRSAIATRDIEAGELILVEKPYTSVLMPEENLTHCHHCLRRCSNLIGCVQCSSIGFCSKECRSNAWQDYHNIECDFLGLLQQSKIDFGHLSLRMIIKAGFKNLLYFSDDYTGLDTSDPMRFGINSTGIYDSFDYASVYSLVGHSEDRSLSDLFRRAVIAVFLLKFIEHYALFTEDITKMEERKICIGSHILKQLQMLPCNAHEVSELHIDKSNIASSELKEIGSAIYATLSLLNHSCDPSVVRHSYGDACALRAVKNIPKGGEIIDNYGALYAVTKYQERQSMLSSQYYFTCKCGACRNHWPLYSDLKDVPPEFKCSKYELPINKQLFDCSRQKYLTAMEAVLGGGDPVFHEENLQPLLQHMQLVSEYVKLPWQEFNNCQEIVKQCFSMLANHYYIN